MDEPRDFRKVQAEMRQTRERWLKSGKDTEYEAMNKLAIEAAKLANEAAERIAKAQGMKRWPKVTPQQVLRNGHLVGWGNG